MTRFMYMHTIEGAPGVFCQDQIFYATRYPNGAVRLVESLQQINKEQRISTRLRKSMSWPVTNYGWVKVRVES